MTSLRSKSPISSISAQQQQSEKDEVVIENNTKTGIITKYNKGKFLGKGGFAKVYEFENQDTHQIMAAKIIQKSSLTKSRAKQKLMTEIKIHKSLKQQNIVNFLHVFEDENNVYILLELCTNQTMNELVRRRKRLTELETQCYFVQITKAVKYLHQNKIIHRDLKLGNMFLSDKMEIKLGDFGLACKLEFDGQKKKTICGTPNYIAPEILEGKDGHSYEVDIWSMGVILYTFLIGKPPFETSDVKQTYKRIKSNQYSFPEHIMISQNAKNLIQQMLQSDPAKRITIDQIMNHPFFATNIPQNMPCSTLACPPSSSFLRQFSNKQLQSNSNAREFSTERKFDNNLASVVRPSLVEKKDFQNTERINNQNVSHNNKFECDNLNNPIVHHNRGKSEERSVFPKQTILLNKNIPEKDNVQINVMNSNNVSQTVIDGQNTRVKKWVDYSSKYGLGYLINNGTVGVCFNDSTKIIFKENQSQFIYIERKGSEKIDHAIEHNINDYPSDLKKKVTLLQHFKGYLIEDQNSNVVGSQFKMDNQQQIYVKKWMKTKHAIMFRLSNKVVQVVFQDQTEIILSSELRVVTYVNKKKEMINFPLSSALESNNKEMTKRLKYTKDILTQMLGGNIEQDDKLQAFAENNQENLKIATQSQQNFQYKTDIKQEVLTQNQFFSYKSRIRSNSQIPNIMGSNNYISNVHNY